MFDNLNPESAEHTGTHEGPSIDEFISRFEDMAFLKALDCCVHVCIVAVNLALCVCWHSAYISLYEQEDQRWVCEEYCAFDRSYDDKLKE